MLCVLAAFSSVFFSQRGLFEGDIKAACLSETSLAQCAGAGFLVALESVYLTSRIWRFQTSALSP